MSKSQQPTDNSWGTYFLSWLPFTSDTTGQEMLKNDKDGKGTYQEMQLLHKPTHIEIVNEKKDGIREVKTQNKAKKKSEKKLLHSTGRSDNKLEKDTGVKSPEQDKLITVDLQDGIVYVDALSEPETNNSYWDYFKQWASDHKSGIKCGLGIAGAIITFVGSAYLYYILFLSKNNVNNPSIGQDKNNFNGTFYDGNQYSGTSIEDLVTIYNKTVSITNKVTKPTTNRSFDNDFQEFFGCFKKALTTYKQRIKGCMNKDFGNINCKTIVKKIDKCNNVYVKGTDPKNPFLDNQAISQHSDFSKCIRGEKYTDDMYYLLSHKYLTGEISDYCD